MDDALPEEEAAHVVSDEADPVALVVAADTSDYHVFSSLVISGRQVEHLIQ